MAGITQNSTPGLRRELAMRGQPGGGAAPGAGQALGAGSAPGMITTDNWDILLTQEHLRNAANAVSAQLGRKMTASELSSLVEYIRGMPPRAVAGLPVPAAIQNIATGWVGARESRVAERAADRVGDPNTVPRTAADMEDYQRAELLQLSPSESGYKFSAFADRRGNAIIDRDRVIGNASAPHGIAPLEHNAVQAATYAAMTAISGLIGPDKWSDTMRGLRESYLNTFQDVQLPRQTIQFDSRNARPAGSGAALGEFQWLVHNAGQVGQIGDIRIQDTIQQIMMMEAEPFWIPLQPGTPAAAYNKIRMLIREFSSQSVTVPEFASQTSRDLYNSNFHFEFDITEYAGGRARLVPAKPQYVFRLPMAIADRITVQFRSPFELLELESGYASMTMTYGAVTTLTMPASIPHGIQTGSLVYILNSSTGSTTLDRLLTVRSGYIATVTSPDAFTIPVDSSAAAGSQIVQVFFAAKRVFFNITFTSVEA